MLLRPEPTSEYLEALDAIKGWTRHRFRLAAGAPVLVAEVACRVAGCPPRETVVAFWTADDTRHQFRLYKPVLEVAYADIGWLMGWPEDHGGAGWECC
jgi:hypothetical protein